MPQPQPLYSIWYHADAWGKPWKAQLVNYTTEFLTEELAVGYVEFVKKNREREERVKALAAPKGKKK